METIAPEKIREAKESEAALNRLIMDNESFILRSASSAVKHFVTKSDDEFSIAMIAFHDAIFSYDEDKGNFNAFASLVIKRRLLDKLKSDYRRAPEVLVDGTSMDGSPDSGEEVTSLQLEIRSKQAELSETAADPSTVPGTTPVQDEIEAVTQLLAHYDFSFYDLTSCSPKAGKTKDVCAKAVTVLLKKEELFSKMRATKSLPMKEMIELAGLPRKILERHRKYIIAAAEILNGEYPLLAEYMNYIRKELWE